MRGWQPCRQRNAAASDVTATLWLRRLLTRGLWCGKSRHFRDNLVLTYWLSGRLKYSFVRSKESVARVRRSPSSDHLQIDTIFKQSAGWKKTLKTVVWTTIARVARNQPNWGTYGRPGFIILRDIADFFCLNTSLIPPENNRLEVHILICCINTVASLTLSHIVIFEFLNAAQWPSFVTLRFTRFGFEGIAWERRSHDAINVIRSSQPQVSNF